MYNDTVYNSLPDVEPGQATAILERLDGLGAYTFIVNPEEEQWNYSAEYAKLPVANTAQPIVKYKYSDSTLSLPKVHLWAPGNTKALKALVDNLASFTRPIEPGGIPPALKFSYGEVIIPRCYLKSFQLTSKMRLSGALCMADATMEILMAPELPAVELAPKEVPTTLTERECADAAAKVKQAFTQDPKLAAKFKTDPKVDVYTVAPDKTVSATGAAGPKAPGATTTPNRVLGKLDDILGPAMPDSQKDIPKATNDPGDMM